MKYSFYEKALIVGGIIGFFVLIYACATAAKAGTVCQIANGCTGTSTAPSYGKVLVGGTNGEYEYAATSSFGSAGSGTVTSVAVSSPNSTLTAGGTNPVTTTGTINLDINLSTSNQWTASTTLTKVLNLANASSSLNTLGTVWIPSITSSLVITDSNGKTAAYGGTSCTNQFVRSLNGAGVATCNSVSLTADVTGTLGISNGGTNAGSFTTSGNAVYYNGTALVTAGTSNAVTIPNASTTNETVSTYFSTGSNSLTGFASSSPSANFGVSISTTTVVMNAQIAEPYASSTASSATVTVNWNTGNSQSFIASTTVNLAINSTSSNPIDGGRYLLKVCQDPAGSRTVNFITPGQLRWANGTTSVGTTANTCTLMGMIYDSLHGIYDVVASSTGLQIN